MTFKKFTLTNLPFFILIIGLSLLTAFKSSNTNLVFSEQLIESLIFNGKLLIIWFALNKVLMYLNLFRSRLIFLALTSFYAITQASARIEAGEYLQFSHLKLLINSFSDSMLVTLGSFHLLNLILILVIVVVIAVDYYFHKKHIYKNQALFILSLYLLTSILSISLIATFSQNKTKLTSNFSGSLPSLSNKKLNKTPDYNVLIFIYESLSWDYSSFSDTHNNTPHIQALAKDGVEFLNMNAYTPHSSKSLFSILCGSAPILNQPILETASNLETTCLADLFKQAGYSPYFIQSASGTFESRARLVYNMGFEHFYAREDLKSPKLGYLASDDAKLFNVYQENSKTEKPFFLTFFTSSSHHPYVIPKQTNINTKNMSAFERYLKLQQRADLTLGKIIEDLKQKGLYDNTLIIALADHGEGFGINNVKQHVANFYDEGLHVPAVIKFPAQFKVKPKLIKQQYSLVNVAHFVVDQLNNKNPLSKIKNLLSFKSKHKNTVYFNCWNERKCFGWKEGELKTVLFPKTNTTKTYSEINNQPTKLISEHKSTDLELQKMQDEFDLYFNQSWKAKYKAFKYLNETSGWNCIKGKSCKFIKN